VSDTAAAAALVHDGWRCHRHEQGRQHRHACPHALLAAHENTPCCRWRVQVPAPRPPAWPSLHSRPQRRCWAQACVIDRRTTTQVHEGDCRPWRAAACTQRCNHTHTRRRSVRRAHIHTCGPGARTAHTWRQQVRGNCSALRMIRPWWCDMARMLPPAAGIPLACRSPRGLVSVTAQACHELVRLSDRPSTALIDGALYQRKIGAARARRTAHIPPISHCLGSVTRHA
jgi:hypothetical protein